ncbi:MAG TPA: autorepressor SdpR family transcription factor [Chthonomonadales bacterium]|nr:autorepressor SdpR family transcription factor [Chthonomonadales bacterium]
MTIDAVFKALADPTRRSIIRLLNERDMTAGELAERFPITAPSMSHHYSVLKQADLVVARREGQQIVYSLNTTVFQDIVANLMDIFGVSADEEGEHR